MFCIFVCNIRTELLKEEMSALLTKALEIIPAKNRGLTLTAV